MSSTIMQQAHRSLLARIPDFMGAEFCDAMIGHALAHRADWFPTGIRQGGQALQDRGVRISDKVKDIAAFRPRIEERVTALLPSLARSLNMPMRSVTRTEIELVRHGDGAFYKRHIDTAVGADRAEMTGKRWLSIVHYFHRRPRIFTGGALRMHALAGSDFMDVEPEFDLAIAFPAWLPHEVLPVQVPGDQPEHSRFAINIWLRV